MRPGRWTAALALRLGFLLPLLTGCGDKALLEAKDREIAELRTKLATAEGEVAGYKMRLAGGPAPKVAAADSNEQSVFGCFGKEIERVLNAAEGQIPSDLQINASFSMAADCAGSVPQAKIAEECSSLEAIRAICVNTVGGPNPAIACGIVEMQMASFCCGGHDEIPQKCFQIPSTIAKFMALSDRKRAALLSGP